MFAHKENRLESARKSLPPKHTFVTQQALLPLDWPRLQDGTRLHSKGHQFNSGHESPYTLECHR